MASILAVGFPAQQGQRLGEMLMAVFPQAEVALPDDQEALDQLIRCGWRYELVILAGTRLWLGNGQEIPWRQIADNLCDCLHRDSLIGCLGNGEASPLAEIAGRLGGRQVIALPALADREEDWVRELGQIRL